MKRAMLILFLAVLCLRGQDRFTPYTVDIDPTPIPATPTAVWTVTVFLEEVTLTNSGEAAVVCTITDRQSPTPRALFSGSVNAGSVYIMPFRGRKMPGGVTWSCAETGVIGYLQGRR